MSEQQTTPEGDESQVIHPARALPRKYVNAILYLADRMSEADKKVVVKERSVIEELADAVGKKAFRTERWYRDMSVEKACGQIDIQAAKRATLVVLALVLKADFARLDSEHEFFHRIRKSLEADPVTVPVAVEAHKALALQYLAR